MTAVAPTEVGLSGPIESVLEGSRPCRTIRVALAGCGVVGSAFARLLHSSSDAIAARNGARLEIVRVLVRDVARDRDAALAPELFTDDLAKFIAAEADVVVEAIGGRCEAELIARATLTRGARLVTANKELVASRAAALYAVSRASDATLDYGAAVGGSVPVIATLRDLLGTSPPGSVRGILNGTSNYILSRLEQGSDYAEALADACGRGLAEADCTRDMDGSDSAAKLAIVAWVCFGIDPAELIVHKRGLLPDPARVVRHAHALGARVRLLAEVAQVGRGGVVARVEPVLLPPDSAFARTVCEDNRVEIDAGWARPLCVSGPGAGGEPTAASLLADVLSAPPRTVPDAQPRFRTVADARAHSWLVAASIDPRALSELASDRGIRARSVSESEHDSAVVTGPVAWSSVQGLLETLERLGLDPLAARVDPALLHGDLA